MRLLKLLAVSLLLFSSVIATAKDKKKLLLPKDVLQARTVMVAIDPQSGISLEAPNANRAAREAVERELMNWGRFHIVDDESIADLVITVRKGNGKNVQPTIGGIPQNNRPVVFQPSDAGCSMDASQCGPTMRDPSTRYPTSGPQVEAGPSEDMFAVYRGRRDNVLEAPPVWRYTGKGSLNAPHVRAVEEFRRLIVEAEKQEADSN